MKFIRDLREAFNSRINYGRILDPAWHLRENYGQGWQLVESREIEGYRPLNMNDFPGENHCSLVSLSSIFSYYRQQGFHAIPEDQVLFKDILSLATRKFYYNKRFGTKPLFISLLGRDIGRLYGYDYDFKNSLFLLNSKKLRQELKATIDRSQPAALSFVFGDYRFHTVSYYGYQVFKRGQEERIYLLINDNWSKRRVYIDLSKLGVQNKTIFMLSRRKVQA